MLYYSDDDDFRPKQMKRVTPKKREPRSKKAKVDPVDAAVAKRLQDEKAQHAELLRREGVVADDRAAQSLDALRGQTPTFARAHAAQAAAERAKLTGPQLPPTHRLRIRR